MVEIIGKRMVHKERMTVKSMLFHGFHEWIQHTALHGVAKARAAGGS
jgi:hypothetical protein